MAGLVSNNPSSRTGGTGAGSRVVVTKDSDSLAGRVFQVLKEDAEHVLVEIRSTFGTLTGIFHKSNVKTTQQATSSSAGAPIPAADVAQSTAGTPTPKTPVTSANPASATAAAPQQTAQTPPAEEDEPPAS